MARAPVATDRLDSWKAIASYLGRDVRTVIRWEQLRGLPVHRVPGGGRQVVFAHAQEIDEWLERGRGLKADPPGKAASDSPEKIHSEAQNQFRRRSTDTEFQISEGETTAPALPHRRTKWPVWVGAVAALIGVVIVAVFMLTSQRKFLNAGETQITNDGAPKMGLVTDGVNLYFGEWRNARIVLSTVSVQGGPIREIPTPFVQTVPVSVSKDGRQLLVLTGEGVEREHALWTVSTQGGLPQRVGNFLCHSAAWSPDGQEIVYSSGNAIYITTDLGVSQHQLQSFAGVPDHLNWSLDGKRILFMVRDMRTRGAIPWEIVLSDVDHLVPVALVPLSRTPKNNGGISPALDSDDDFFLVYGNRSSTIQVFERSRWPWKSDFAANDLTHELGEAGSLAAGISAQQLYFLRNADREAELDRYDKSSHLFQPFLPGVSAHDVDFSRDGHSIVYVQAPQNKLWVANSDGGSAEQINTPGLIDIELPRWSPDGKQIAFMGKRMDAPWRIYVTRATGENVHEASHGNGNQGAPTWSPDGGSLVYGRVECQEENTCAIDEINLATGQESVLQGSDGLSTARWSPNGRYIAALRADKFQVYLLDLRTQKWRKLADGVNGNDLAWAPKSDFIYASKPEGDRPQVIRISLRDGKAEPAVDLTSFSKLTGHVATWFSVTPDSSILFMHGEGSSDIYALHYVVR